MKKQNLPTKICKVCNRSFTWRKKWKLNWDKVKYCSKNVLQIVNYWVLLFLGSFKDFNIFDNPVIFRL